MKGRKEKDLWAKLKKAPAGHWERIETKTRGISDVIFAFLDGRSGFVELKHETAWPVRAPTNFGLESEQALFLHRWQTKGGRAYIFVWVGDDLLLFQGRDALEVYKKVSRERAYELAIYRSQLEIDWNRFLYII